MKAEASCGAESAGQNLEMDKLWGEDVVKVRPEDAARGQLFDEGNYAMFIHWGLYAHLANKVDGKTYYGIGEWIMNPNMAGIPVGAYKALAREFNPVKYDAMAVAQLAKDAGMKYIVLTGKHHEGFAMYHSACSDFNIVDATPFKRDVMKELADACREVGIGFGVYYSHNLDWTEPGGAAGLTENEDGSPATFEEYFARKCLPQVREITSGYGPLELIWFDCPGSMSRDCVQQLVDVIRKNQPNALISGRAGHELGDYQSQGDMNVPIKNVDGMWEACDTTNDSWAYAWYDEHWKTPKTILRRLLATVGRGGTYLLNIGLRGDGAIPPRASTILRSAGKWVARYPQVVYATGPSPWQHEMPWGDVTTKGETLFLAVFEWPSSGALALPGLKTGIKSARLLRGDQSEVIACEHAGGWVRLNVPAQAPETLVSIIEVDLEGPAEVDTTWGLDPECETQISVAFADVAGATIESKGWMEKFGEWKHVDHVHDWQEAGKASWAVDVLVPGEYHVDLTYAGEGRLVWGVDVEGGEHIRNQQNSSHNYQKFPMGWIGFQNAGRYTVSVSCLEGDLKKASLTALHFTRVVL